MGDLFSETLCQHTSHVLTQGINYADNTLTRAAWFTAKMLPHFLHVNSPWFALAYYATSLKAVSPFSLNRHRKVSSVTSFMSSVSTLSFFYYGMASDHLLNPNLSTVHRCKHLTSSSSDEGVLSIYILKYM